MSTNTTMRLGKARVRMRSWLLVLAAALSLGACGNSDAETAGTDAPPPAVLGPENIVVVDTALLTSGPVITGTIRPERDATVRAEVSGAVLRVRAEAGQAVRKGEVLLQVEQTTVRDVYLSARAAVRTADAAAELATRNLERTDRLHEAGAVSNRELESARVNASSAAGAAADARARLANAQQQLNRTTVRAPFNGVVADVPASEGDIVSPGTALVQVVDPASMQLEATVPVEQVAELRVGTPVQFTVAGYEGREFDGKIIRVNPSVDPATRQVRILVALPNGERSLVGGLFAEGRVTTDTRSALVVPVSAVNVRGLRPTAVRLKGGRVERVEVATGLEDRVTERLEIRSGLVVGDTLLVGAAAGLSPGTMARVRGE